MEKTDFIETPLPVVYRYGKDLVLKNGIDLNQKEHVWGIRLLEKTFLSLYDYEYTYSDALKFSGMLEYKYAKGFLPSKKWFEEPSKDFLEDLKFDIELTVHKFAENPPYNFEKANWLGAFWTADLEDDNKAWKIEIKEDNENAFISSVSSKTDFNHLFVVAFE